MMGMGGNDVEVKLGADNAELIAAMRQAASAVEQGASGIKASIAGISSSFVAVTAGLVSFGAITNIASSVIATASSFEQLELRLKSVMGSAAGGEYAMQWLKDFAKETPFTVESATQSFMMLKNFGIDPLDGSMKKVADSSAKYNADINRVTLALGQAWGRAKLQGQDILQLIDAGIPVWDLLSKATGKNTAELQKMSEKGEITREVMKKLIDQMGADAMGVAGDAAKTLEGRLSTLSDTYSQSIDDMRQRGGLDFIKDAVVGATEVIPDLVGIFVEMGAIVGEVVGTLAGMVSDAFGAIFDVIRATFGQGSEPMSGMEIFVNMLRVVRVAVIALRTGFEESFAAIRYAVSMVAEGLRTFADVASAAFRLDWNGVVAAAERGNQRIVQRTKEFTAEVVAIAAKGRKDMEAAALGTTERKGDGYKPGAGKPGDPASAPTSTGGSKADGRFALMQAEARMIADLEKTSKDDLLKMERAYWEAKLATVGQKGAANIKLRQQIEHQIAGLAKKQEAEERQLKEVNAQNEIALEKVKLDAKRDAISLKRSLGQISAIEEIQQLKELKDKEYQLELKALQDKVALYELDAVEKARINGKIKVLEEQHARDNAKTVGDIAQQNKRNLEEMFAPAQQALETSIQGMIMGTQTWRQALGNIFQSVLGQYIAMMSKKLMATITGETATTAAVAAGATTRTTIETVAAGQKIAVGGAASLAGIMNSAWEAMAGAYKAIAGIPFVGPVLAPVVAAGAFAAVAGMAGNIMSAEGGYDIPAGVNPMVQTHQKEMILPAKYADVIRGMAAGGGAAGGGTNNHYHISAMDARSFRDFVKTNSHALAPGLRELGRNFTSKG